VPRAICGQVPLMQARSRAARHLRAGPAAADQIQMDTHHHLLQVLRMM
jgi:hypothetical protein